MDHYYKRIQDALDKGDYDKALKDSNRLLCGGRHSENNEGDGIREKIVQLIHQSGIFEKMLAMEEADLKRGGLRFSIIYELYKFEIHAFGEVSVRVMDAMATFYENRDDRMSAINLSERLLEMYLEQGHGELVEEARKRVDKNITLLKEKATHYQQTGEHRFAFNSYRCLLECNFESYEYHHGYLYNAIKSGKPEEAYRTILKVKAHRDYILGDEKLEKLFYDLAHVVAADEERPDTLH